jgi:hypothetical protein
MIRRVDNVSVEVKAWHPWTKKVGLILQIGRKTLPLGRRERSEVESMEVKSRILPVFYGQSGAKAYWRYKNRFFVENDRLELEEVYAVLEARDRRQQAQIQRAKNYLKSGMPRGVGIPRSDLQNRQRERYSIQGNGDPKPDSHSVSAGIPLRASHE